MFSPAFTGSGFPTLVIRRLETASTNVTSAELLFDVILSVAELPTEAELTSNVPFATEALTKATTVSSASSPTPSVPIFHSGNNQSPLTDEALTKVRSGERISVTST